MFKIVLKFFILFHVLVVFFGNFLFFSETKSKPKTSSLNNLGRFLYYDFKVLKGNECFNKTRSIYTNLTGTDRCYEYFSPNLNKGVCFFEFYSEKNQKLDLSTSIEGNMKISTFNYIFFNLLKNKKIKDEILKSVSNRLFFQNRNVKKINVYYIEVQNDSLVKQKKIKSLAYVINKGDLSILK